MAEKKTSTEMTVEEKLKNLYALQKVLSRIDEIRIIRGELPLEVQDLEDEIEGLTTRIANKKEEVAAVHLALNKWSEEKKQAQVAIERCNEQLNSVSNSREYDNLSKEIEYQGLEIELRDKRIREKDQVAIDADSHPAMVNDVLETSAEKKYGIESIRAIIGIKSHVC